jgi:hypothetical protein
VITAARAHELYAEALAARPHLAAPELRTPLERYIDAAARLWVAFETTAATLAPESPTLKP